MVTVGLPTLLASRLGVFFKLNVHVLIWDIGMGFELKLFVSCYDFVIVCRIVSCLS